MDYYALTILIISAKFDEYDDLIPLYKEYRKMQRYKLNEDTLKITEKNFLNHLDWNLNVVTPNHLASIILGQGIVFENDRVLRYNSENEENEDLLKTCNEAIQKVDEKTLRDVHRQVYDFIDLSIFCKLSFLPSGNPVLPYRASIVTASCILCARKQ
jgi:hypothetical protein